MERHESMFRSYGNTGLDMREPGTLGGRVISAILRCCFPIVRITPAAPGGAEDLDALGPLDVSHELVLVLEDVRRLRLHLRDCALDARRDEQRPGLVQGAQGGGAKRIEVRYGGCVLD